LQVSSSSAKSLKKHTAKNSQGKPPIDKHPKELHSKQAKKASKDFGKHKADRRVCVCVRERETLPEGAMTMCLSERGTSGL
jgi:hypothetical protein